MEQEPPQQQQPERTPAGKPALRERSPLFTQEQLQKLSAGSGLMLWSFPVGILAVTAMLRTDLLRGFHLPLLALSLMQCGWGAFVAHTAQPIRELWSRRSGQGLWLIALALYFSPFLYWWTRNPSSYYFAINSLLFAMCLALFLLYINAGAGIMAEMVKDKLFLLETRMCGWIILILVTVYFGYTLIFILIYQFTQGGRMFPYNVMRNGWVFMVVPFALTMGSLWKIRATCKRLLSDTTL